jgi:phosphoglycerate dehydrogenase-like enzyme
MVDRGFLEALGPAGFLINVARPSVVVTPDLIDALVEQRIAGAGVDLWEGDPEPVIPEALISAPNIVFTPHIASHSPDAAEAAIRQIINNLSAHFRGEPLTERVDLQPRSGQTEPTHP